jgi:hypothetical protein
MILPPSMRGRRKQAIAIFIVLAGTISVAARLVGCRRDEPVKTKTRPVTINVLPVFVDVPEQGYSHPFSIPNDATNAHLEGEFTVDPRPQGQSQMLIVSAEGMGHWQRFLSSTAPHNDPGNAELIYRSGDTIADRFDIKMTPGIYDVIFDYGPAAAAATDHFGGGASGPAYRRARSQIRLAYDLPCEICP